MEKREFLLFPVSSIRRSIKDIDDSYRNPWDIYAELTQNAIDAIHKMQESNPEEKGEIELSINAQDHSIEIKDNGCGISQEDLPKLLELFASGKSSDVSSVGEKGVGLKFAYFQSTYFEITSHDGSTGGRAIIRDARLWKKRSDDSVLTLDFEKADEAPRGTQIVLKGVEIDENNDESSASFFQLSFDQLKYVLRSKTYLGDTSAIWGDSQGNINVNLIYVDRNGEKHEERLKNSFMLPIENLRSGDIVDIEEFEDWVKKADRSDTEKRNKLQGKVLVLKGSYLHKGYRRIQFWACFMPSRRDWDNINTKFRLLPQELPSDKKERETLLDQWSQDFSYCLFTPGIFTSTKGMPTGIAVDTPRSGRSGYWPNCFMMFQDDSLSFDIGRKAIHGRTQTIYQAKAKELFTRITNYVVKYTSSIPATSAFDTEFDRFTIRSEVDKLVDLDSDRVHFQKIPSEQEASVSAIFFQLIGNQTISDIEPIYLGYRNKYDLYAYYTSSDGGKKFCFMEFKSHLRHITKDFSEARKVFDEMDYIICWDVNDTDVQELLNFGITCEQVDPQGLHALKCPASVTHRLTIPNCNPVYVIDLKKLM